MAGFDPTQVPTFPVEIDWSHPLASGLQGFWLPGLPPPQDLTGRYPSQGLMTISGATYYPQIGGTPIGPAYYSPSTNSPCAWVVNDGPIIGGKPQFSILAIVQTTFSTVNPGLDIYAERAPSGEDILQFTLSYGGSTGVNNSVAIIFRDDSGNAINVMGNTVINDGKLHYVGATLSIDESTSVGDWQLFIDGSLNASGSGTLTTAFTNSGLLSSISGDTQATTASGGPVAFEGYIPAVGVYAGILPPEAFAQWKTEPFSMLKPIIRKKYYFPQTTSIININSYGEIFGESGQSQSGFMFGNSVGENSSYPLTNLLGELALTSVGGQFAQEVSEGGQISQIYIQQTELGSAIASNLAYSNQKTLSETNSQGMANQFVNSQIYTQQEELGSVVASNLTYSSQNVLSTTDSQGHAVTSLYAPVLLVSSEDQSVSQGIASLYVNSYVYVQQIALGYESASNSTYSNQSVLSEENAQGQAVVSPYVPVLLISSEDQSVSQGLAIPYVNSYVSSIYDTAGFSGQSVALSASIEAFGETTGDIAAQAYVSSHVINIGSEGLTVSYGGFDNIKRYTNAEYLLLPFKNFNKISIG